VCVYIDFMGQESVPATYDAGAGRGVRIYAVHVYIYIYTYVYT